MRGISAGNFKLCGVLMAYADPATSALREAIREQVVSRIRSDVLTPAAILYLVERATQIARERLLERDLEAEMTFPGS